MEKDSSQIFGLDFDFVKSVVFHTVMQEDARLCAIPAIGDFEIRDGKVIFLLEQLVGEPPLDILIDMEVDMAKSIINGDLIFSGYISCRNTGTDYFLLGSIGDDQDEVELESGNKLIEAFFAEYGIKNKRDLDPYIEAFDSAFSPGGPFCIPASDGMTVDIPIDEFTAKRILAAYPDGVIPTEDVRIEHTRTGRNDICPCGSGRKFKKCCGKAK